MVTFEFGNAIIEINIKGWSMGKFTWTMSSRHVQRPCTQQK